MTTPTPLARGIAAIILIAASAGGVAVGFATRVEHEARGPADQIPSLPALEIDAGQGDIRAVGRPGATITYESSLKWIGRRPSIGISRRGEQLRLRSGCPSYLLVTDVDLFSKCDVDLDVGVPATTGLTIDAGSGDISLEGLNGAVSIDSGTGSISATRLRSPTFAVDSGTGDVTVAFVVRPESVSVDSGTGDITVRVPSGRYDITSDSGVGSVSVEGVVDDPTANSRLMFDSGVGDIRVEANDG
jgi:Putative adhesin